MTDVQLFSDGKPKIIDHLPDLIGWLSWSRQVAVNEQGVCYEQCEWLERTKIILPPSSGSNLLARMQKAEQT